MKNESVVSRLSPFEREIFENVATVINQKVWERGSDEGISGLTIADMIFI